MHILTLFLLISLSSCDTAQPTAQPAQPKSQERPKRYAISQHDSLVLFDDIVTMTGQSDYLPSIAFLTKNKEIYLDSNIRYMMNQHDNHIKKRHGLGPSYVFDKIDASNKDNWNWLDKSSMKFAYERNQVKRDYNDLKDEDFVDNIKLDDLRGVPDCELNGSGKLLELINKQIIWDQTQNPIIELSSRYSYNGAYFISEDGRLWRLRPDFVVENVNQGIKFLKNSQGRYFINASMNDACLQSDQLAVYCFEFNELGQFLDHESHVHPHLRKVFEVDYKVEEVSYSGRHVCLLSSDGRCCRFLSQKSMLRTQKS